MPALELVVTLLAMMGTKHTTVINQVSNGIFGPSISSKRVLGSRIPNKP